MAQATELYKVPVPATEPLIANVPFLIPNVQPLLMVSLPLTTMFSSNKTPGVGVLVLMVKLFRTVVVEGNSYPVVRVVGLSL